MLNIKARRSEDPGIGTNFDKPLDRLVGKDGRFHVRRLGEARTETISLDQAVATFGFEALPPSGN